MTKLLELAIESVRQLPEGEQDIAAKFLLGFADPDAQHYQMTEEQSAEVELARKQIRAGMAATDQRRG